MLLKTGSKHVLWSVFGTLKLGPVVKQHCDFQLFLYIVSGVQVQALVRTLKDNSRSCFPHLSS